MEPSEITSRKTKLEIIRRLWGHVYDLLEHAKGTGRKPLGQIEKELDLTEYYCRPYADCDDDELYAADVLAAARGLQREKEDGGKGGAEQE